MDVGHANIKQEVVHRMNFFKNVNKWFYAFAVTAVLLIAAVVVAVILGVGNQGKVPDTTPPAEGVETGIYYYDLEMGELQLALSGGNQFSLTGPGYNTSGEYTVSENVITLDFRKDEEGTATATVEGDTLILTLGDAVMTFRKKVSFTVSYNTNGGGVVSDAYVVNGRPAPKPADPVRDGFVFLGWYADEGLTTPFDFAATLIEADTMLYARWAEKIPGAPEYTVSFVPGYEGADPLPDESTIGGKLYTLPVPTREGYVFNGWFTSMYGDGDKLTAEFTADTPLTSDLTLYAVWAPEGAKLPSPKVSVTATSVKWNAVVGASAYRLKVTAPDGTVLYEETVGSTAKNVDFSRFAAGDYVVEVSAVANKAENSSDAAVRYYRNKALDAVTTFTVIDGTLLFNAVKNAERYLITIECGNPGHNHTELDNGRSTNYYFGNCTMKQGGILFTVTAVAEGYAESVSKTFSYERALEGVTGLTYDKTSDSLVWNPVLNAIYYTVEITVGDKTETFRKVMDLSFSLGNYTGDITASVTPVTEGFLSPEAATATCKKTAPAIPQGLSVTNTTLTWADGGAASYEVKIGDKTFTVNGTSFDLTKAEGLELTVGEIYAVSVRAIKDGEASAFCAPVSVGYYQMVPTLSYSANTVYWTPVIGCTNYEVRVNGGAAMAVSGASSAKVVLTKAGLNVIEVRCTDLVNDEWVAMQVNAYAVTYMSRTDKGEITEYLAVGDTMTLPRDLLLAGFTLDGWYNVPDGAEGNGKEITDTVFNGSASVVLFANWKPNEYKIIFNVDPEIVDNLENGSHQSVLFNKEFTLPVPHAVSDDAGFFKGWYTDAFGKGTRITDDEGLGLAPYTFTEDLNVYPFFDTATDVLAYELLPDGTYSVKAGPKVGTVTKIRIPATYQGVEITELPDNAFQNCSNLRSISMPDTIRHIGVGAFDNCGKMESFEIYKAKEGDYEIFYGSHDGALLYFDKGSGNDYLEIFPRAKTGTYTLPETVDTIRPYAFNNAQISKVIISKTVTAVSENAFYNCGALETIEFATGRESDVTIHASAFSGLSKVTMLKLPARITPFDADMTVLRSLPALNTILVEEGSSVYTAVDNFLCDASPAGLTILYVPQTVRGEFKAPMGISGIGANVFNGNLDITSVVIPAYINSIGADAFKGCHLLTTFTVEGPRNGALTIGSGAFQNCSSLELVDFAGSGAKARGEITVGDGTFQNCSALTTFRVGEGVNVASIGTGAFKNDTNLTTIEVADSATLVRIGDNAFEKCTGLESFAVHKSTTYIGSSAFKNCSQLLTFAFGESDTPVSFGNGVFSGCSVLKTIRLPKTLSAFDGSVFNDCLSLQSIEVDAANPNLQSKDGVLYVKGLTEILYYPKNLDGDLTKLPWDKLQKIGAAVFKNNQRITTVKIGANIVEIGEGAFYGCTALTSVSYDTANKKPLTVGAQAFYDCTKLKTASLPASTTAIGAEVFYNTAISAFTLPESLTIIGARTFANSSLTSVVIPASVTTIGNGAFAGSKLTSLTFVGGSAPLIIGTADAAAGNGAFEGTKLTSVTLPANLEFIGAYAFASTPTLKTVTVPSGELKEIGMSAFKGCSALSSISFRGGLSVIGDSAFEGTALTTVSFPGSITYIGVNAFKSVPLTSVVFTNGPANASLEIGEGAFAGSRFATINLPSHLTELGSYNEPYNYYTVDTVFEGNTALHTINVHAANRIYRGINGVLYLRPVTESNDLLLVYCPRAKTGYLTVPKNVYMVGARAFYGTQLTTIVFEEYDKNDASYGQPLLTIGSFSTASSNGSAYAAIGAPIGSYTNLVYIKLPSHLDTVNSFAMYNLNKAPKPKDGSPEPPAQLIIEFNKDAAPVSFKYYAISNNSALKTLTLPRVKDMGAYAFGGNSNLTALSLPTDSPMPLIASNGFYGSQITGFTVPDGVTAIEDSAFNGCTKLTSFDWGNSKVTYLGNKVFGRTALTSFKIADTVTSVGAGLFEYNTTLKSVELSSGMTTLFSGNDSIFKDCNTIETVSLPEGGAQMKRDEYGILYSPDGKVVYYCPANVQYEGILELPEGVETIEVGAFNKFQGKLIKLPSTLKAIKNSAFRDCALEMIIFPASLETIGDYAFYTSGTSNLHTIAFEGNNLKSIGYQAFYRTAITSLYIPDGISSIGYQAFNACNKMTTLSIPGSVTLADQVFVSCSALKSVTIREGLRTIPARTFRNCTSLTTISVPDSVTSIGDYAFTGCTALESVYFGQNSQLTKVGNSLFSNCKNLKTVIFGDKLSALGDNIFNGCVSLTEVHLPNALTSIPASLFLNNSMLESVNIPTSVTSIGASAFQNCVSLKSITISAKVKTIGQSAFAGCTALTDVVFADGCRVTSIPTSAFDGDTSLTSVNLPSTVTSIGNYAFRNTAITAAELKNVGSIGTEAFLGCSSLKSAAVSGKLLTVGARAFSGCSALESINLTTGLKSIGEMAFADCTSLKSINLPSTLTTLSGNPFSGCSGVTSFTVDSGNKSFIYKDGALFDKTGFTLIYYSAANTADTYVLPDSVHQILSGAFAGSQLKTFEIPATSNITEIPADAFRNSKLLTSVVIPATIKTIGANAFRGCVALKTVHIPESVTVIGDAAFADCSALTTVTVADRNTDFISVGSRLFENCVSLTHVVDFRGIKSFTEGMYANTGLVTAIIPAGITNLYTPSVFENCASLKSVVFHNGITSEQLGQRFFYNCSALESVSLPASMTMIGDQAFMNCTGLTSVVFEGPFESISHQGFEGCSKLVSVTFASEVPVMFGVGERAFANCSSLTDLSVILSLCDRLSSEAFLNCSSLTGSLTVSKKFNSMGAFALSGTNLTDVYLDVLDLTLEPNALSGLPATTTVHFLTFTETIARKRFGSILDNTDATLLFVEQGGSQPEDPTPSAELTKDEINGIDKLCAESKELGSANETLKAALLEYKKMGFLDKIESEKVTEEEIAFIEKTVKALDLLGDFTEKTVQDFTNRLMAYKKKLMESAPAPSPSVELTKDEINGIDKLCAESKELGSANETLKAALLEYKKMGFLDKIESEKVTEEEIAFIEKTLKKLGLPDDFTKKTMEDFINRLMSYKKTLMKG